MQKFFRKNFAGLKQMPTFADAKASQNRRFSKVFVAQLVEQLTLNQWVQGSSPCEDTLTTSD